MGLMLWVFPGLSVRTRSCSVSRASPGSISTACSATRNDYERLERTGQNRAINRHQWQLEELEAAR
jgi:hypothetical protein